MAENTIKYQFRDDDSTSDQHSRTGRFFVTNGHWFFKTREGIDYGPFDSRTECKYAYSEFIEVVDAHGSLGSISVGFGDIETTSSKQLKIKIP